MRMMAMMLALPVLAGCRRSAGPAAGEVSVEWRGSDRGRYTVAATAAHCPESGIVEVIGIRGDTALGLALFLPDSAVVGLGAYQVFHGATLTEPRPGATAGVRWFTDVDLAAFESVSGTVTVAAADDAVSGTLAIRMQGVSSADTLALTGEMKGLPVTRSGPGCGRTSRRNIR